jgi:hypothetical protein
MSLVVQLRQWVEGVSILPMGAAQSPPLEEQTVVALVVQSTFLGPQAHMALEDQLRRLDLAVQVADR